MFKQILSYYTPILLKKYTSQLNGPLQVNLSNGRKVLNSNRCNFSYGVLQKILYKGLLAINFPKEVERVLVLGMGAGSIVETIRFDFNSDAFIELVEIDQEIIAIAVNEFGINNYKNISIIHADGITFLKTCVNKYDLIIIDVFVIDTIPEAFTQPDFIRSLSRYLSPKGKIIYNTIRPTITEKLFNEIRNEFSNDGFNVQVLEKVETSNNLIIATRM